MITLIRKKQIVTLALASLLSACGGGGGGTGTTASTQTFVGTITGFGSVFVNGVEFDTSNTSISVDDNSANESSLKVGMLVTVQGSANGTTGTASSITFNDDLEGLVISNGITAGQSTGTMNIMGQTVTVTTDTIFESKVTAVTTLDQVTTGMIMEVSGYSSGTGAITATRIELKAADLATYLASHPEGIELKGKVSQLDSTAMTFSIGGMVIDYSGAVLDNLPNGPQDTLYVEVKSIAGLDANNRLVASKVELEDQGTKGHDGNKDDDFEIKGKITRSISQDTFEVNGQVVVVNNQTDYDDITKSQLVVGVMVEVEGKFDANKQLVASEVEKESSSSQELKGTVSSVTKTATNQGSITLNGQTITIDNNTIMKDSRDKGVTPNPKFNLMDLFQGDYVEVHVYTDKQGNLVASKLERDDL